jgi:hypothetical protein
MAERPQTYYRPYDSGDESDSGESTGSGSTNTSGSTSSTSSESWFSIGRDQSISQGPNFSALAKRLQGGISDNTLRSTFSQDTSEVFQNFNTPLIPDSLKAENKYGTTKFATESSKDTIIITVDSLNRDKQAFPQPTFCRFRFPRAYRNVTALNIAEIKLLTSFYVFSKVNGNTDITIYEQDRNTIINGVKQPLIITTYINDGSYNITSLISELQQNINQTPVFYDFINGFDDFVDKFNSSGDYSLVFNQPGDYFYNRLLNQYIPSPSLTYIITYYWQTRYATGAPFTTDQLTVAYYYPVLKDILLDKTPKTYNVSNTYSYTFPLAKGYNHTNSTDINLLAGIGIDPTILTVTDVFNRCIYSFQGINDQIITALIYANKSALDAYRLQNTFRFSLVNKYMIGINSQTQNVYFTAVSLNTSLINLINLQQVIFTNQILNTINVTSAQYNLYKSDAANISALLQSMYSFQQKQFLKYFAVPWNQYSISYYANSSNSFLINNGINAINIPSNYSESIAAGIQTISTSIFSKKQQIPYFWPGFSNTSETTTAYFNLSNATSSFNAVYRNNTNTIDLTQSFITSNTKYLYSQRLRNTADVICPIESGKYTIFNFNSPVRQTIQVETLSRPTLYRIPAYNQSNFDSTINKYFNYSYRFRQPPYIPPTNLSTIYDTLSDSTIYQIPGWSPNDSSWGLSYTSSIVNYSSNYQITINNIKTSLFLQFTTPPVPNASSNSNYTYQMNLTISFSSSLTSFYESSPPIDFQAFMYHDRGAFMGDVTCNRSENPFFYKYSAKLPATGSNGTISFTTYPNQTYYVTVRSDSPFCPKTFVNVVPWFSSSFQITPQSLSVSELQPSTDILLPNFSTLVNTNFEYAQVYDSNWIQLPIKTPYILSNVISSIGSTIVPTTYQIPIGYDTNGVSTDYTDYIPFIGNIPTQAFFPSNYIAIDPINQYIFQKNSEYSIDCNSYFYEFTDNTIFKPGFDSLYTPTKVAKRQYKIAHYYSVNYIPISVTNTIFFEPRYISDSNSQKPYTLNSTQDVPIPGYVYRGSNNEIQLDNGILGFTFIPERGTWDIKRFMFRSAIDDYTNDPNQYIAYLGIYLFGNIINTTTTNLSLSNAIVVLSNSARVTYTSNTTETSEGFDVKGGTYYEFIKDNKYPSLNIAGYSQNPGAMVNQPESMYCFVGFTSNGSVITIKGLSGSVIPYPYYNTAFVSTTYLDGTPSYVTNKGVVFPSTIGQETEWPTEIGKYSLYAPIGDSTQSHYELSHPIGTSVLLYKKTMDIIPNSLFLNPWVTSIKPIVINGNVNNYMLMQDTQINIYGYNDFLVERKFTNSIYTFTVDEIFSEEKTSLVAIGGNNTLYYFLGFNTTQLRSSFFELKEFNPRNGQINRISLDSSYVVPSGGTVKSFSINNSNQLMLVYKGPDSITGFYYSSGDCSENTMNTRLLPAYSTAVHTMDSESSEIYWLQLGSNEMGQTVYQWDITSTFTVSERAWSPNITTFYWNSITMNAASAIPLEYNRIFLANTISSYTSTIFYNTAWTSTATSKIFSIGTLGNSFVVETLNSGYKGSTWFTEPNSIIWGNRNSEIDIPGSIAGAWQIFYPFQKIVLESVDIAFDPASDVTSGTFPEYGHSQLFYYSSRTNFCNDIQGQWGLESNFIQADVDFTGYYFNSRLQYIPLTKSSNSSQYIAVRGYSPTESFESLLRFIIPNQYTFGYLTITDIINEIAESKGPNGYLYDIDYKNILLAFDTAYNQSATFGANIIPTYNGIQITTSNFNDFTKRYNTFYTSYQKALEVVSKIQSYVNSNIIKFININLSNILPPSVLKSQTLISPLLFQIQWNSSLLPQYKSLVDNWGLGYNLGFTNIDSGFSVLQQSDSFYKIIDDYIYLRISPEYNINSIDATNKEVLSLTRDSTGSVGQYFGKLLLGDFNTFSRTFVSNQVTFNPPIARLDKLSFEWLNSRGVQINNANCDWSASIAITEYIVKQTSDSTIPSLPTIAEK